MMQCISRTTTKIENVYYNFRPNEGRWSRNAILERKFLMCMQSISVFQMNGRLMDL